jgi:putative (di)nucleoside polyphosphate hydrolase
MNNLKRNYQTSTQKFRAGVGAIIVNANGLVFAGKRKGSFKAWQFPQGGILIGETPQAAVYREIEEETGIKPESLDLIAQNEDLIAYELPPELRSELVRGQIHYWFLFRFIDSDDKITLGDRVEFENWQWMEFDDILAQIVSFKKRVYEQLKIFFKQHVDWQRG